MGVLANTALLAFWNNDLLDSSGNGHTLELAGAAALSTAAVPGRGTHWINIPSSTSNYIKAPAAFQTYMAANGQTGWTIEQEGMFTSLAANNANFSVGIPGAQTTTPYIGCYTAPAGNVLAQNGASFCSSAGGAVQANVRFFVALAWQSSDNTMRLYVSPASAIDSTQDGSVVVSIPWPTAGGREFRIGHAYDTVTMVGYAGRLRVSTVRRMSFPSVDPMETPSLTPGLASLAVSWTDFANPASLYHVLYSTTDNISTATLGAIKPYGTTSCTLSGLSQGTTYYVWVRAYVPNRMSYGSGAVAATAYVLEATSSSASAATQSLAAPTSLAAGTPGTTSVPLTWTDAASPAVVYDVYAATSELGGYSLVEVATQGEQAVTVHGLNSSTTYWFKLKSRASDGTQSSFTSAVSATTAASAAPIQPTLLQATALGATQVRLSWVDGADTLAQLIYQSSDSNFANATRIGLAYAGAETFLVTGLTAATPYWFWVEPVNAASTGTKSGSATATTTAAPVLSLTPAVNDLAYDLVRWLVQEALASGSVANFVDGEISSNEAQSGKIHLFAAFADDLPTDCGVVTVANIRNRLEFTPVREARVKILLRTADDETSSARVRAEAATKAVIEFTRDESMQDKTHVSLPSGRTVLIFQDQQYSPGGMDASGRYQVLVEFRMQYLDTITQSN